jgi:surfeit locus 1 family protein
MSVRSLLVALVVVAVAAVCVRLGFWQVSRLHEKQRLNAALREAMARPPMDVTADIAAATPGRRVRLQGRYDETRQVLLAARAHEGSPGVHVVTPLLVGDSLAVLVDRGWLPSADASYALPQRYPEPGPRDVVGIAAALSSVTPTVPPRVLESDSVTLLSARQLDPAALSSRFPYRLAGIVVRQLPGPGVPDDPVREPPRPYDEMMHLSYAIQWFTFAAILLVGSSLLARRRRRESMGTVPLPPRLPG